MKTLALAAALLASTAVPAMARLQLSIASGGSTFSCFDGQLSCDVSGGANNLLTIDQTVGNAFVQITLAQSTFGKTNELQLSSSRHHQRRVDADHHQPRRWRHRVSTADHVHQLLGVIDVQQRGRLRAFRPSSSSPIRPTRRGPIQPTLPARCWRACLALPSLTRILLAVRSSMRSMPPRHSR